MAATVSGRFMTDGRQTVSAKYTSVTARAAHIIAAKLSGMRVAETTVASDVKVEANQ